jgi:hypothetical protein
MIGENYAAAGVPTRSEPEIGKKKKRLFVLRLRAPAAPARPEPQQGA